MTDNSVIPKQSFELGIDFAAILCNFRFDNHDCLVVELAEETESPIYGHEICRFTVNNRCCAIVIKPHEVNLGVVLTARELQIVSLVALGCPNKQVADKLNISEWTVATYLRRVFAKLGVDTRAAMIYRCASLICTQEIILTK